MKKSKVDKERGKEKEKGEKGRGKSKRRKGEGIRGEERVRNRKR